MYSPSKTYPSSRAVLLVSLLIGLFSFPLFGFGGYLLVCWSRIHTSAVYYADYSYATSGQAFVAGGLVDLSMTFQAVRTWQYRMYSSFLFLLSLLCFLLSLGWSRCWLFPHFYRVRPALRLIPTIFPTRSLSFAFGMKKNHRFPADESEFREAMPKGPAAWQYRVPQAPEIYW
jgi:hypothetical protein